MNDILLTLDDIKAEHKKAHEAWWAGDRTVSFPYFWQDWLCRAQLRKVVALAPDTWDKSGLALKYFFLELKAAGEGK